VIQEFQCITDSVPATAPLVPSVLDITAGKAFLVLQNLTYLNPPTEKLSQKYQHSALPWIRYTKLPETTLVPVPPRL